MSSCWKRARYENHSHSQRAKKQGGDSAQAAGWTMMIRDCGGRAPDTGDGRSDASPGPHEPGECRTPHGAPYVALFEVEAREAPGSGAVFGPCEGENRDVRGSKRRDRAEAFSWDGCRRGRRRGLAPGDRARRGASVSRSRDAYASGGPGTGAGAARERRTAGNPVPSVARRHGIAAGEAVEGHRRVPLRTSRDRDRALAWTGSDGSPGRSLFCRRTGWAHSFASARSHPRS